jgi:hypothetical protein
MDGMTDDELEWTNLADIIGREGTTLGSTHGAWRPSRSINEGTCISEKSATTSS